ncbi:MAG: fumarylacetoacetate hydrolase family protein [Oscillospiraceae bacterium]|jgi:2-keto-4-pentenoate hydratase/2-oxohepta-3-ene-1,7-dioic acid hydratase in catechol pathway|nr:fumarylacetoacetate hydrolase family protein [Oscillospiraceae bacterium]
MSEIIRFVRYLYNGEEHWGISKALYIQEISGDPCNGYRATDIQHSYAEQSEKHDEHLEFLPPCQPGQMIIVGWNYKDHTPGAAGKGPEIPLFYPLSPRSIIGHGHKVIYPVGLSRVEHEAELVVIIGKRAKNVKAADANEYILGYSCGNDVSARDIQNHPEYANLPRAKTVDTFSPIGPFLVTGIDDPSGLAIEARVNGEVRQSAKISDMFFSVPELIESITQYMTLEPWDVIFTGTPQGPSAVHPGDTMVVQIEKVGALINQVV